jgi:hypothetical protein
VSAADMQRVTRTPKAKRTVWLLAVVSILAEPIVEVVYYTTNLRRGAYPVNADSIAIPIYQFTFGWLVTLPVVLAFVWFVLRDYPGSVSFLAYNTERPVWSFLWSAVLLLLVASYVWFAVQSITRGFPLDVAAALLSIYLLLCFRSSIVFSRAFVRRSQAMRSV